MKVKITKQTSTTEEVELIEGMCFRGSISVGKVLPNEKYLEIYNIEPVSIFSTITNNSFEDFITDREFYEVCLTAIQKLQSQIELIQQHL